jgi:hypothetical protein
VPEWNAYRYARLSKAGGGALYAISLRAYGDKAEGFLQGLKQSRSPAINAIAELRIPIPQPAVKRGMLGFSSP